MTRKYQILSRPVAFVTILTILFTFATYQLVVGAPNEWQSDNILSLNQRDDDDASFIAGAPQNLALRTEAIPKRIIVPDSREDTFVTGDRSNGRDIVITDKYSRGLISEMLDLVGRLELQLLDWGWSLTITFARVPSYDSPLLGSLLGLKLWYPIK